MRQKFATIKLVLFDGFSNLVRNQNVNKKQKSFEIMRVPKQFTKFGLIQ